jgi:secreted PhoX family phosphatase
MTLAEVLQMADEWQSSATSSAIRYAKFTTEACVVVLSEDGRILFWIPSDEAAAIGFKYLSKDRQIPRGSPTALAASERCGVSGGKVGSASWFPQRSREVDLWEEACPLGNSGRVLTLLAQNQ